jgi:hypothetical protein
MAEMRIARVLCGDPDLDGVAEEIRPFIERCLAKAPSDRPAAADILAELGGADRGGGDLVANRLPAPVAIAGDQAGVVTQSGPVTASLVTAEPVLAAPGAVAEPAAGAPVLNVTVTASDSARVIVAGGDVHVNG